MIRQLALLASLLALSGCPEPEPEPVEPPTPGVDVAVPAAPDEARAGIVRSGDALFGGINAEGRAGDVKLYNDRVQFVIGAARPSHGYVAVGGTVLDADLVRPGGQLGRDTLEDVFVFFGLARLFEADSVEVLADGSDGGEAVVRVRGHDVAWPFIQGAFEFEEPTLDDLQLELVTDYALAPGSWSLRMTTTYTNAGSEPVDIAPRDGMMTSGEDLHPFSPGRGLADPDTGALEALGVSGRQGEATLSLWPAEGTLENSGALALAAGVGIVGLTGEPLDLAPGGSTTRVRYVSVAPDSLTAEAERWTAQGVELAEVAGVVSDPAGPVAGARVHFVGAGDAIAGFAVTDEQGAYAARLPPGDWTAWPVARAQGEYVELPAGAGRTGPSAAAGLNAAQSAVLSGDRDATPLAFATGRATPGGQDLTLAVDAPVTADLSLPPPSGVRVAITDDSGAPLPGVIEVVFSDGAPASVVPSELREGLAVPSPSSRALWAWTHDGTTELPLVPGTYDVIVGHGWRHGRAESQAVEVPEGQTVDVQITLPEVVPRDGWLSMDSHLHGAPSFDSGMTMEDRVITCAATGVDVPVATDHDRMGDYQPVVDGLGLTDSMLWIPGLEVTTILRGHFNLFPATADPAQTNGGAEPWWDAPATTQELFERMRARADAGSFLQANHPRTVGLADAAGYQRGDGSALRPTFWSWDFDLYEMINTGSMALESVRADWFSFLNTGRIRVPTGVSDSHYRTFPCGHGRTDVFVDADSPADVTRADVLAAVRAGHVVVAGGTTLRATLDGALPGETVAGASATLAATVSAPPWMPPGVLRVYRNGEVIQEQDVEGPPVDGVWFEGSWTVDADADAWFAVEVEGDTPLGPAWRDQTPYALTNAFFLDVDGGGWSSPR